jgi:hypothetical protein
MVLHVAGGEDAFDRRSRGVRLRDHVAVVVEVDLTLHEVGVGVVPDGHEQTVDLEARLPAGDRVAQREPLDPVLAEHLLDHRVPHHVDLVVGEQPLLHDLRGAQLVSPVDERDLRGELREEHGLFERGVTTAHHADRLAPEEEPVAGRARGHAVCQEPLL